MAKEQKKPRILAWSSHMEGPPLPSCTATFLCTMQAKDSE